MFLRAFFLLFLSGAVKHSMLFPMPSTMSLVFSSIVDMVVVTSSPLLSKRRRKLVEKSHREWGANTTFWPSVSLH
jgi:hypothetical protein